MIHPAIQSADSLGVMHASLAEGLKSAPEESVNQGGEVASLPILTWLLVATAVATTAVYGIAMNDVAPAIVFLVLSGVGYILFRRRGAKYFAIAYSLNAIVVVGLAVYLSQLSGAPFLPGGDEITFHEASLALARAWAHGQWGSYGDYTGYSGYGFVMVGGMLQLLTAWAGNTSPITIRELNAFVGATIPVAVHLIGTLLFGQAGRRLSSRAAAATAAFPILVFYSAVGLRDIWIAAAVAWCSYSLLWASRRRFSILAGLVWPAVLATVTFYFRPSSLAPYLALYAVFLLVAPSSSYARLLKPIAVLALGATLMTRVAGLQNSFEQAQLRYTDVVIEGAGDGSLGAKLLGLPAPTNQIARFLYASYAPVPPLQGAALYQIIVGLGAVEWYFLVPLAVAGTVAATRLGANPRALALATTAYTVVLLAGIAMTSVDVRHKVPIFAVAILWASLAMAVRDRRGTARLLALAGSVYVALAIAYVMLKLL